MQNTVAGLAEEGRLREQRKETERESSVIIHIVDVQNRTRKIWRDTDFWETESITAGLEGVRKSVCLCPSASGIHLSAPLGLSLIPA